MWLENWSIVEQSNSVTEVAGQCLSGTVYGNPRFCGGTSVITSPIVSICDGTVHTKSGSIYQLGHVNNAYETAFPNARERLLQSYCGPKELNNWCHTTLIARYSGPEGEKQLRITVRATHSAPGRLDIICYEIRGHKDTGNFAYDTFDKQDAIKKYNRCLL
jgi:hypothetical protein